MICICLLRPHPLAGFYGVSYTYLSTFGAGICIIVGIITSLATGKLHYFNLFELVFAFFQLLPSKIASYSDKFEKFM